MLTSLSISKVFEFLVLKIELSKDVYLTLAGCYRPPSAISDSLVLLQQQLSTINFNELLLVGDFNWDWLSTASNNFKSFCDTFHLTQLIDSPTRLNTKCSEKSTLLDLFLTNSPHKYINIGVFANDVSDHCVIAAVRNTKRPKSRPQIICTRNRKHFVEQAFHHDLYLFDWSRITLINDVELAWNFFYSSFMHLVNKHAPMRKIRVKAQNNPWFTPELARLLHDRDLAWAKARSTKSESDWLNFRKLRNLCTSQIKKCQIKFLFT